MADRDELARSVLRNLERSLARRKLDSVLEILSSPLRLARIPLSSFGIELENLPEGERLQEPPSLSMNELRTYLQDIEDIPGRERARGVLIRTECIYRGVIRPRLEQSERDALVWVRFLLDGEHDDPESALQHVCRLTDRKRETVHRSISRFFGDRGIEQPAPLDQPLRLV